MNILFTIYIMVIAIIALFVGGKRLWKHIDIVSEYETHREMTANKCEIYGDGTFEDFIREFYKYEWRKSDKYKYSLFHPEPLNDSNYLHAGIFRFNNIGMRMKTLKDYKRAINWIKFYVDEHKDIYDWTNNRLLKPKA